MSTTVLNQYHDLSTKYLNGFYDIYDNISNIKDDSDARWQVLYGAIKVASYVSIAYPLTAAIPLIALFGKKYGLPYFIQPNSEKIVFNEDSLHTCEKKILDAIDDERIPEIFLWHGNQRFRVTFQKNPPDSSGTTCRATVQYPQSSPDTQVINFLKEVFTTVERNRDTYFSWEIVPENVSSEAMERDSNNILNCPIAANHIQKKSQNLHLTKNTEQRLVDLFNKNSTFYTLLHSNALLQFGSQRMSVLILCQKNHDINSIKGCGFNSFDISNSYTFVTDGDDRKAHRDAVRDLLDPVLQKVSPGKGFVSPGNYKTEDFSHSIQDLESMKIPFIPIKA
jgi:hypothetical protein